MSATEQLISVTPEEVSDMTAEERQARVYRLLAYGRGLIDEAIGEHFQKHAHVGTVALFSGGNDSTTMFHAFRNRVTHAAHANTGIGVEATRQFVRDTCKAWGIPLIEKHPPAGSDYRSLVLEQGFPGPAHHWKMYQRLKERCLRQVQADLVTHPRRERVIFLAGRRRDESKRRSSIPEIERVGSAVWVSPMAHWTKLDLNTYRNIYEVPRNDVADLIHMSGECLCGAFAKAGELDEVGYWFPEVREEIEALEGDVLATGAHPAWRCRWGWGADKQVIEKMKKSGLTHEQIAAELDRSKSGRMCSSCVAR